VHGFLNRSEVDVDLTTLNSFPPNWVEHIYAEILHFVFENNHYNFWVQTTEAHFVIHVKNSYNEGE
jgi:hypothetical protein